MCFVRVVSFAIAVLASAHASAQSLPRTPAPHTHGIKKAVVFWAAAVAADQMTTYRFSSRYHDLLHEENVLVKGLDGHPVWLVSAGTALDEATGWTAWKVLGARHPRLARLAFYGAGAYRSYLAVSNIEMMRRANAVRAQTAPHVR
jgi:hypothetical protein